ncbi:MAG: DUF697 domain-containing protein [bacterium]|nr:DUF697 domain-containing protein [bacterium]
MATINENNTENTKDDQQKDDQQKIKVKRSRRRLYETGEPNETEKTTAPPEVKETKKETKPTTKPAAKTKAKVSKKAPEKIKPAAKKSEEEPPVKTAEPPVKKEPPKKEPAAKKEPPKKESTKTPEPPPPPAPVTSRQEDAPEADNKRATQAHTIVKKYAYFSLGTTILPLPLLDVSLLTALQLKMIQRISKLYDVPFQKHLGKSIILSLLGGLNAFSLSRLAFRGLLKIVPGAGYLAGLNFLSVTAITTATTYAIGKVFIQHFETGGTLLNLKPQEFKEYMNKECDRRLKEDQ